MGKSGPVVGVLAAAALLAALAPAAAIAQERLLTLRAGSTVSWDDNLFRLPASAPDPHLARGVAGKSDMVTVTSVGLNVAKAFSQQRFSFDVTRSATRHDKFSFLDRELTAYRGEALWQLTPRLSGALRIDRSETPVPFDETRDLEANTQTTTSRALSFNFAPFGGWQLVGGVNQRERKHARPSLTELDTEQDGVEAGLRYVAASGTSLSVVRRQQRGTATGQLAAATASTPAGDFSQDETELAATWPVTGRSTLSGRLTGMRREHAQAPERNFSGTARELSHAWAVTGQVSITSTAQRTLTPFLIDVRSSYRVDDVLAVSPAWQATDKIRVGLRASRQESDYRGALVPLAAPARRDVVNSGSLFVDWAPRRAIVLRASLRKDRRDSNDAPSSYESTTASLGVSLEI